MGEFATDQYWLPLSSGAAQLFEPFLQNGLLTGRDAREHNTHSHIGELKHNFSACCKCCIGARDSDHNLCALWRRIDHVQKTSPGAQVAGPGAQLCFACDFGYLSIRDDGIAWDTTPLGVHSSPPSSGSKYGWSLRHDSVALSLTCYCTFPTSPSHLAKAGGFVLSSRLPFSLLAHDPESEYSGNPNFA